MNCRYFLIKQGRDWDDISAITPLFQKVHRSTSGEYSLLVTYRGPQDDIDTSGAGPAVAFCVGDEQASVVGQANGHSGNGICAQCDVQEGAFQLRGSLSGLPPLFGYHDGTHVLYSNSVALIGAALGGRLQLDHESVVDLATVGHPVGGRTLFSGLRLLDAGIRVSFSRGNARETHTKLPETPRVEAQAELVDGLATACQQSVSRLPLDRAFLSLTAGLDTRAILAVLAAEGRLLPAYTLAGRRETIDSQRAAALCKRYGMAHGVIFLDGHFRAQQPALCEAASLLSGGIASFGQAHEVHFYSKIGPQYSTRLSGNLGNQVGRGATEGVSVRNVNPALLGPSLRASATRAAQQHWFRALDGAVEPSSFRFLVQQENLYASQANYAVGHHYARQLTPYADVALLALKARAPAAPGEIYGIRQLQKRDLMYRVFGESEATSFQRRIVNRCGGAVATVPVNWGWCPKGGVTPGGLFDGFRALLDMATAHAGLQAGPRARIMDRIGIAGYGDFHERCRVCDPVMREFLADTLEETGLLHSDMFDRLRVTRLLRSTGARPALASARMFLLDVALAQKIFTSEHRLRESMAATIGFGR